MGHRESLLAMLDKLREDMLSIQQTGAGYYSCIPMIKRYNKLLDYAKKNLDITNGLLATFDDLEESDPNDPADKTKVIQSIRVEIGQLMSLIDSMDNPIKPVEEEDAS